MATVTEPITLDKSINTTENPSRNIADVLAEELKGIADSITTAENVENILTDMATTKTAPTISGTAVFDTVDGNFVKSLKVEIVPSQSGSGTPSPSNIRPISGYTEEVISVKDSTDTTQATYTTPFNQTVYGGTLDVLTGELTIDSAVVDLGSLTYNYDSSTPRFYSTGLNSVVKRPPTNDTPAECVSSMYADTSFTKLYSTEKINGTLAFGSTGTLSIINTAYTDANAFKTAMSGQTLVYPLATPATVQLTPQKVKALVGENHISASTGDVLECKFSMLINGDDLAILLS